MPIYEYECGKHGSFEMLQGIGAEGSASCPSCGSQSGRRVSVPARAVIHSREQLPYGKNSRGKFIPPEETGGLGILVPSFGALEAEEVEYTAQAAVVKEKERQKNAPKAEPRKNKVAMANLVKEASKAPKGQRKKTLDKIRKEGMV